MAQKIETSRAATAALHTAVEADAATESDSLAKLSEPNDQRMVDQALARTLDALTIGPVSI